MDMAAYFSPPEIMDCKRVLCIQPHPDDNEIGMGATIAALAARGCEVHYLTVTNGDLGLTAPGMTHEHLAALRRAEAMAAGKVLGVEHFHFWEEPDGSLQDVPALAARMGELIRTIQPDAVFCPDPWAQYEAHFDHIVTGRAAAQAFIASSLMAYPRGTQTAPWTCKAIGFYFTQAPNTIVDVTDTLEAKFAAMAEHRTQLDDESLGLYKVYFGMQAQRLGAQKGYALGEGFKVLSGMHLHCFAEAPGI